MEFKDLDGAKLEVSAGHEAVIMRTWRGSEYTFLAFDPYTAVSIASAIEAAALKVLQ